MKQKQKSEAAERALGRSKLDPRNLVPSHLAGDACFWRELLFHVDINPEERNVLYLLLGGCGFREACRSAGIPEKAVRATIRHIYGEVGVVVTANKFWVRNFKPGDRLATAQVIRGRIEEIRRQHPDYPRRGRPLPVVEA